MSRSRHWSEQYSCHVCGKAHRSYAEDARHRHNFPALCRRKKEKKSGQAPSSLA